jgi:hypothetical protein
MTYAFPINNSPETLFESLVMKSSSWLAATYWLKADLTALTYSSMYLKPATSAKEIYHHHNFLFQFLFQYPKYEVL